MWKTVLKREIQHNLYSLRFLLSLALILAVFIAGSLSFVRHHAADLDKYRVARDLAVKAVQTDAASGATNLAVNRRSYDLRPRDNGFLADAKEKYLPNSLTYSAWNVFGFANKSGSANPYLARYDELSWAFAIALLVSFAALIFTFDAVSGEKESKTLSLALANPVSRGALLFGKYASAVVSVMAILAPGVLVGLLILTLAGTVSWGWSLAAEVGACLLAAAFLAAAMSAFGLLCSVLARSSNVSLLLALTVWLLFAMVIPNSSGFLAKNVFPIEKAESVQKRVQQALDDLSKAAPPGSWMMNSNNPFLPQHELRANLMRKRMAAEKAIRDDYYRSMFLQFERTRRLTAFSPVAAFEFLAESIVGGGYPRFRRDWDDLHVFQGRFLSFFQALDAADPKSPHWFNPRESVSTTRQKVSPDVVPTFSERPMSFADRLGSAWPYLLVLAAAAALIFSLGFGLFVRYDVR
ncbi:MAG: ABC transporter permease subunit [Acidobacteriota bacterium]|nr:ABC transporter permease subunit [Acidobacteriota bacterium]